MDCTRPATNAARSGISGYTCARRTGSVVVNREGPTIRNGGKLPTASSEPKRSRSIRAAVTVSILAKAYPMQKWAPAPNAI